MRGLFRGGIHPPSGKALSLGAAVQTVSPKEVAIPLLQHVGAPCKPCVAVGQRVLCGQRIAVAQGLGADIHASVSGTVCAIAPRPHVWGRAVESVVIKSDLRFEAAEFTPCADTLAAIRRAGIVGMGGAAFPTAVKIEGAVGKALTLIANGCECEPYITADQILMTTQPQRVLQGLEALRALVEPRRTVLAVEADKKDALAALRRAVADYPHIELAVLPSRYPQGSEKQLIRAVTGREVPPGGLPGAVGCCVVNVSTCAAVCRAVMEGRPLTERIVTVSGEAVEQPGNFLVPVGTTLREVLRCAGGPGVATRYVLAGGAMMGLAQTDLDASVTKATNAILCLPERRRLRETACIRCGRCVAACPMHLQPLELYAAADAAGLERLHLSDCIACGCCSYVCPAQLPLAQHFRRQKQRLKEGTL